MDHNSQNDSKLTVQRKLYFKPSGVGDWRSINPVRRILQGRAAIFSASRAKAAVSGTDTKDAASGRSQAVGSAVEF